MSDTHGHPEAPRGDEFLPTAESLQKLKDYTIEIALKGRGNCYTVELKNGQSLACSADMQDIEVCGVVIIGIEEENAVGRSYSVDTYYTLTQEGRVIKRERQEPRGNEWSDVTGGQANLTPFQRLTYLMDQLSKEEEAVRYANEIMPVTETELLGVLGLLEEAVLKVQDLPSYESTQLDIREITEPESIPARQDTLDQITSIAAVLLLDNNGYSQIYKGFNLPNDRHLRIIRFPWERDKYDMLLSAKSEDSWAIRYRIEKVGTVKAEEQFVTMKDGEVVDGEILSPVLNEADARQLYVMLRSISTTE